ncbi:MAG: hypothetical protein WBB67_12200 [bacterium]
MISAGKGTRITNRLVQKGLVKVHEINLGGRGGSVKFLELTEKGHEAIGMKPRPGIGKGAGFEHEFWQCYVSEKLKNNQSVKKVAIEGRLLNKFIDILIETENEKIAVEIEMSQAHVKENVAKDVESGCDRIIIACKDRKIMAAVQEITDAFSGDTKNKLLICTVQKAIETMVRYLAEKGG